MDEAASPYSLIIIVARGKQHPDLPLIALESVLRDLCFGKEAGLRVTKAENPKPRTTHDRKEGRIFASDIKQIQQVNIQGTLQCF